jgi:hypothetical protein
MKPDVALAVGELEASLTGSAVRGKEDRDGGAYVVVDDVAVGDSFSPRSSWIGFHVVWTYPDSDVYPHFISAGLKYVGSGATPNQHPDGDLPAALTRGATMPGFDLPAIQVSRRSNHRNADTDTACQKLLRIIEFLRTR